MTTLLPVILCLHPAAASLTCYLFCVQGINDEEKTLFYATLVNSLRSAWQNREVEGHLTRVWEHISTTLCRAVTPEDFPNTTLMSSSQYPVRNPEKEGGDKTSADTHAQGSNHPLRIPDAARILDVHNHAHGSMEGPVMSQVLIDTAEMKRLNTEESKPWGTDAAREAAGSKIPSFLFQVYATAMAAFDDNPKWEDVYAMLVIGIYYTQLHWKRPSDGILATPPSEFDEFRSIPSTRFTGEELDALIKRVEKAIEDCEARVEPEILAWNEPIVLFKGNDNVTSLNPKITLNPLFLWSMRQPLKKYRGARFVKCWLSSPSERPQEDRHEATMVRLFICPVAIVIG